MFFYLPGCFSIIVFIVLLPALLLLGFFQILKIGFVNLGISPQLTILILLSILIGSFINIPLSRPKFFYREQSFLFGVFKQKVLVPQGLAINLGGAVIPVGLSIYFLTKIPLKPAVIVVILMIFVSNYFARFVPGRGVGIPLLLPPILAVIFALVFSPQFAAPTAFVGGVLGILFGADILNLKRFREIEGLVSIGGAGVFDGIFLVGILSALLAGF